MCGFRIAGWRLTMFAASLCVLAALLAASAHADTLSGLRAKLASLDGQAPVQAVLTVKTTTVNKKENGGKPETGDAQFDVRLDGGLNVDVAKATLQQAATELAAAATNADHPTPTASLLDRSVDAMTLAHLLAEGPNLLRKLAPATAATMKSTTLWGRSVREVTVTLPAPKSSNIKLKDFSDLFSVWLDADGVPIAAAEQTQGKGCLLFMCMQVQQSSSYTLQVVANRLIASGLTTDQKQSGLGQDSDTHTSYSLQIAGTPKTAAPPAVSKPK